MQRRSIYWLGVAGYMLGILGLSSIPGIPREVTDGAPMGWLFPTVSNLLHIPLYAGLAAVCALALVRAAGMGATLAAVLAVVIATAFGVIDEAYQVLTPGRYASLGDVLANAFGATLGSAVFLVRENRLEKRGTRAHVG